MSEMQAVKGKVWKSIELNKAAVKSRNRFLTAVYIYNKDGKWIRVAGELVNDDSKEVKEKINF